METEDYYLTYFTTEGSQEESAYVIVNKTTGVWEILTSILPQAKIYIKDLQRESDSVDGVETSIPKDNQGQVVSLFDKKE